MKKIILMGGGGHCKVVIETINLRKEYKIYGIVDLKERVGERVLDVPIIGTDEDIKNCFKKGVRNCFITAGSIGKPARRIRLFELAKKIGFSFPNVMHPNAWVSKSVQLGKGNFIAAGAIINAGAHLGNNCIINTGAIIEHDCTLGDFVHIASGTTLCGEVKVRDYSHIGAGAVVIQCIKIGKQSIIGAGSVVLKDIKDNVVAYGNPCRKVKKNV